MTAATLTEFSPTANHLAFVRHMKLVGWQDTVSGAARSIGLAPPSVFEWFDSAEFANWYHSQAVKHYSKRLPEVYEAMYRSACGKGDGKNKGSAKDRELCLTRFDAGYLPKSAQMIDARVQHIESDYERAAVQLLESLARQVALEGEPPKVIEGTVEDPE